MLNLFLYNFIKFLFFEIYSYCFVYSDKLKTYSLWYCFNKKNLLKWNSYLLFNIDFHNTFFFLFSDSFLSRKRKLSSASKHKLRMVSFWGLMTLFFLCYEAMHAFLWGIFSFTWKEYFLMVTSIFIKIMKWETFSLGDFLLVMHRV